MKPPPHDQGPPVLLDLDFTGSDGPLVVETAQPGAVTGQAFGERGFRDGVIDVELGLLEGGDEDRYGVFFRQGGSELYVAFTLSTAGHASLGLVDGGPPLVVAGGPLGPEVPFRRGIGPGVTNRVTIVSCGPVAAVLVNGFVVSGVAIPERYGSGPAGALLVHTSASPRARAGVLWAQARGLLPDQSG